MSKPNLAPKLSMQLRKIDEINKNGGIALIIRNVKEVEKIIELIDEYYTDDMSIAQYYIIYKMEKWMEENEY